MWSVYESVNHSEGLGSADQVAHVLGGERLMVGVAQGFGASLPAPGHAHHNDMKAIRLGLYLSAEQSDLSFARVEQVAALWREAGFDVEAIEDIAVTIQDGQKHEAAE